MIGIVIVAHGGLAGEYLAAIEHVVGKQPGMKAIAIEANHHRKAKEAEICRAADGVDTGAVAVAWLLAHPANIMPVMGTNNLNRIKGLSDALKVTMDRQTWFELYTAALGNEVP